MTQIHHAQILHPVLCIIIHISIISLVFDETSIPVLCIIIHNFIISCVFDETSATVESQNLKPGEGLQAS